MIKIELAKEVINRKQTIYQQSERFIGVKVYNQPINIKMAILKKMIEVTGTYNNDHSITIMQLEEDILECLYISPINHVICKSKHFNYNKEEDKNTDFYNAEDIINNEIILYKIE